MSYIAHTLLADNVEGAIRLNPLCYNFPYAVEFLIGRSGNECLPQQNVTATIIPDGSVMGLPFSATESKQYCLSIVQPVYMNCSAGKFK